MATEQRRFAQQPNGDAKVLANGIKHLGVSSAANCGQPGHTCRRKLVVTTSPPEPKFHERFRDATSRKRTSES